MRYAATPHTGPSATSHRPIRGAITPLIAALALTAASNAAVAVASPADVPTATQVPPDAGPPKPTQPVSRSRRTIEGFSILVDDCLLPGGADEALGREALAFLAAKLTEIRIVLPLEKVDALRKVTIVLDKECGTLGSMQYHPSADWLADNGYPRNLEKCVHLPRARDVATSRNINEQPWVILHELAHAYHDQVLGFDEPRVLAAWDDFKKSGKGDEALLYDGSRVKHYGLTDQKEFFAEMTEAYFGSNDFHPFNRAQLKTEFPKLYELLAEIWGPLR
jgi:Glucose-regulated metallo-peptidase M90